MKGLLSMGHKGKPLPKTLLIYPQNYQLLLLRTKKHLIGWLQAKTEIGNQEGGTGH